MRQVLKILSTVFLAFFLLFPLSGSLRAEIVVFSATDFPPYEFEKPEEGLRGFDLEVIEAAFARMKTSTSFEFLPWKRAVEQTKRGLFAGTLSCSHKVDREEFFIFSDPISYSSHAYFVRQDFKGFQPTNTVEAKGLKVGAVLGWAQAEIMVEAGADVMTYRSEELLFRDLLKGVIDYAYLSLEASNYRAKQLGHSNKFRTTQTKTKELFLCFSKNWPNVEDVVLKFNEGLAAIKADGTYDAIHAKYK
ncbi:substrate-binding periplasmic protein [Kiloniella sp.]|uniref:substrate-binding periplasmic protein n=1 Tax=Kiloniella sp. TaxID=1938587 RepID=UPI003B015B7F